MQTKVAHLVQSEPIRFFLEIQYQMYLHQEVLLSVNHLYNNIVDQHLMDWNKMLLSKHSKIISLLCVLRYWLTQLCLLVFSILRNNGTAMLDIAHIAMYRDVNIFAQRIEISMTFIFDWVNQISRFLFQGFFVFLF